MRHPHSRLHRRLPAALLAAAVVTALACAAPGEVPSAGPAKASARAPASAASSGRAAIRRATARLANVRLTRFTQGTLTSFDQRLHLCGNGRFIYDTVSALEGRNPDVRRTTGRWRVVAARITGRLWTARVRGVPDGARRAMNITIRTDGRRVTVDGALVIAERSDLCPRRRR